MLSASSTVSFVEHIRAQCLGGDSECMQMFAHLVGRQSPDVYRPIYSAVKNVDVTLALECNVMCGTFFIHAMHVPGTDLFVVCAYDTATRPPRAARWDFDCMENACDMMKELYVAHSGSSIDDFKRYGRWVLAPEYYMFEGVLAALSKNLLKKWVYDVVFMGDLYVILRDGYTIHISATHPTLIFLDLYPSIRGCASLLRDECEPEMSITVSTVTGDAQDKYTGFFYDLYYNRYHNWYDMHGHTHTTQR